ncbi:MAG: TonB-dependent receptor, partial [Acidobacteriia bacterium]|nr:TonB-dependent receptor [Terriglobia bacterium]
MTRRNGSFGWSRLVGVTGGLFVLCFALFSQGSFGRIIGNVTERSGAPISGAKVSIIDTERGVTRVLNSDAAGLFDAPNLSPGTYSVRVEGQGFKTLERPKIALGVGAELRVDLTLETGDQEQTISISASDPLLDTTNATLGGPMGNNYINDLPLNGRNYQNLVDLRPGVLIQPGGGPWTQSTNNIRPDEVAWHVEGVLNANFFDARPVANFPSPFSDAATILPVDAIQEFKIEENPKAEWGWKPGAVVNVGIKSGTNELHGSAYAFGRSDALDARNYFNPGLISGSCLSNTALPGVCDKLPAQLKQFGGVVGGPIKKNKLFFFTSYEGLRSEIGNSFTTTIPQTGPAASDGSCRNGGNGSCSNSMVDAIKELQMNGVPISTVSLALTGCTAGPSPNCTGGLYQNASLNSTSYLSSFPNSNQSDNGIAKIDYHLTDRHTITGFFFLGNYMGVGEDHAFVNEGFTDSAPIRTWSNVETWMWTPTSSTVNVFRFGYNRVDFGFLNNDANILANGKGYPINTGVTNPGGLPNIYIAPFGSFGGGSYLGTNASRPYGASPNPFFDFNDSISYLRGKHAFRFGGEFTHIEADSFSYAAGRGRIAFSGGSLFDGASTGLEDFFAGVPDKAQLLTGNPSVRTTSLNYGAYIQDDWRLSPRLTFNLGLRWSYVSPIKEANNLLGSFDSNSEFGMVQQGQKGFNTLWQPDYKDFSPRFGVAWDVTGKGTTVVRGGASVIYSSYVLYTFLSQTDFQNSNSTSLAAVPTGAIIETNALGLAGNTRTAGGTIFLGTSTFSPAQLNWDPSVSSNPGLNGGKVFPAPIAQCGDGVGLDASPCNIMGVDPHLRSPYVVNWNLSIQRVVAKDLALDVGYVGNHGARLLGFRDINQPDIATGTAPYATQFPWLGYINYAANIARSNFNSLQVTLTKRFSRGLAFIA